MPAHEDALQDDSRDDDGCEPRQVRDAQEVLRVDDARLRVRLEVEHSESGNQDAERR